MSWSDETEAAEVSIAAAMEAAVDGSPPGTQRSDGSTALALSPSDATRVACTLGLTNSGRRQASARSKEPTPSEGGRQQAMLVLSALADLKKKPRPWLCISRS